MAYGWIITQDFIDDGLAKGVMGPSRLGPKSQKALKTNKIKAETFRMLDDDRHLYYKGRLAGDYDGFEPLDDYGMPNAGCTIIQFKNKDGAWEDL